MMLVGLSAAECEIELALVAQAYRAALAMEQPHLSAFELDQNAYAYARAIMLRLDAIAASGGGA